MAISPKQINKSQNLSINKRRHPVNWMLFISLFFLLSSQNFGQLPTENFYTNQTRFECISVKDGLPSNAGNTFLQDSKGYIWIGTFNGLAKYDGYQFKTYQKDRTNPENSLVGNFVRALYEDQEGFIWIGTMLNGLQRFDPINEKFTTYPHSLPNEMDRFITTITGDSVGNIWVGTANGLWRLSSHSGTYQPAEIEKEFFSAKPYPDTLLKTCSTALESTSLLAGFQKVGKNKILKKQFSLAEKTTITVVCQGEYGGDKGLVDYGWISTATGEKVWEMKLEDTYVAPCIIDRNDRAANRLVIQNIELAAGTYWLHYQTDHRHHFGSSELAFLPQSTNDVQGDIPAFPELWGIQLFDFAEKELAEIDRQLALVKRSKTVAGSHITDLYIDSLQQLWVGTTGGLNKIKLKKAAIEIDYLSNKFNKTGSSELDFVGKIYPSTKGSIWFTGHQFNYQKDTYTLSLESLSDITSTKVSSFFKSPLIRQKAEIVEDKNGQIWIAAFTQGLFELKPNPSKSAGYELIHYPFKTTYPSNFFKDQSDVLWIGVWQEGVYKLTPSSGQFHFMALPKDKTGSITSFAESKDGQVFIGTNNQGLFVWDKASKQLNPIPLKKEAIPSITALKLSTQNILWIGTEKKGLFRYDLANKKFISSNTNGKKDIPYPTINITREILEDSDGNIWLGSDKGLTKFNSTTKQFIHHTLIEDRADVHKMLFDAEGNLWWADAFQGLFKMDYKTLENFSPVSKIQSFYTNKTVDALAKAAKGNLWLSTRSGLELFDPKKEQSIPFKNESLDNNLTNSYLLPDAKNQLWMSTPKGIGRYNIDSGAFNLFGAENGILLDEYNGGPSLMTQSGEILVGGKNGFYYFHPADVQPNLSLPKVDLKRLTVQEEQETKKNSINYVDLNIQKGHIELSPKQNSIEIEYVGLHFDKPQSNQYAYRLIGLSDKWINVGKERTARFYSLPAGDYVFEVKASNGDGVWEEKAASISMTVLPPWWKSKVAYLLYSCLLLTSIYQLYQFQIRRAKLKNQLIFEQKEAERLKELNTMKTDFFANMTHEFRTPLTIISGMANQVKEQPKLWLNDGIEMIQRNTDNLLILINQMLDLQKLEYGRLDLNIQQQDIILFLNYILESFYPLAQKKGLHLDFQSNTDSLWMDYDAEKVRQIFTNLISNAIKFSKKEGKIEVITTFKANNISTKNLEIIVKDNGVGIEKDQLPYIFDRFFQVNSSTTRQGEGTGIGLTLTQELVQLLGGTINVESNFGENTTFIVNLPVTQIAPKVSNVAATKKAKVVKPIAPNQVRTQPLLLIIEDNKDVQFYLTTCLQNDYQLIYAENGAVGIEKAIEQIPDIIISDVMMPVKDGFEVCDTLKQTEITSHIPIILLTAKATIADKISGLSYGADAYLAKPFHPEELAIRLEKLVELRRTLQAKYGSGLLIGKVQPKSEDEFLQKVQQAILANLDQLEFGPNELAKAVASSRTQLHRKLKALTDTSTSNYIQKIRLQEAKKLLHDLNLTISEVAYQVGFKTPQYFSRSFTKIFDYSPSQYRNNLKT